MKKYSLNDYFVEPENRISKRIIYSDDNTLAFLLNIAKGESLPEHTHFDCTVLLQVLKGEGNVIVDDKTVAVSEDDLLEIDGQEKLSVDNTGENTLSLYVSISPLPTSEKYSVDVDF